MKILVLLSVLMILASCTPSQPPTSSSIPAPAPKVMDETKVMKDETMMKVDEMKKDMMMSGEMMDNSGMDMMKKDEVKMMKPSGYMNYDEAKVKEALASGQKVALFFAASWCPSCRTLDSDISSKLGSIPADTLIVKVDYDTSAEMKKKYGVVTQHTTVIIDKDMNLLSKKLGARTVEEVLN